LQFVDLEYKLENIKEILEKYMKDLKVEQLMYKNLMKTVLGNARTRASTGQLEGNCYMTETDSL